LFWIFLGHGGGTFLQGVLGKSDVFVMVFCGEVVVILWWSRGFLGGGFLGLKKCHFLKIFLWKSKSLK
jgi:hypothetical protein